MKHLSRGLAIALASSYGLSALPFIVAALLPLSLALSPPVNGTAGTPHDLAAPMIFLAVSGLLIAAAVGLFKEKKWVRWHFLLVSLLALALVAQIVPVASGILGHFRHPPEGAHVVFTEGDVLANLERYVMPSIWVFLFTAVATAFVFHRMR
jgi:hypothetical protein